MSSILIQFGAASMRGGRERNEDAWDADEESGVFALSDGIGGGVHGDIASRAACTAAIDAACQATRLDMHPEVESLFNEANKAVNQVAHWLRASDEMGATFLVAHLDRQKSTVSIAWAGDTVAYLLKEGEEICLLTPPHRLHAISNALTNNIGCNLNEKPQIVEMHVEPGDRLILCTDGVWDELGESILSDLMKGEANAPWLAELLVRVAVDSAGRYSDNATALVVIICSEDDPAEGGEVTYDCDFASANDSKPPDCLIIE